MKFSKVEIEGTSVEITQFLKDHSDTAEPVVPKKSTNETTRTVPDKPIENKIRSVVASIISELKRKRFTTHEVIFVATELVGYASKKRLLERED